MHSLRVSQLIPVEKNKEFWLYEGSETVEPFRETVGILFLSFIYEISMLGQMDCVPFRGANRFRTARKVAPTAEESGGGRAGRADAPDQTGQIGGDQMRLYTTD